MRSLEAKPPNCFRDAQELLQRIFSEKLLGAKAIFGLFPANAVNEDDIEIYDENGNTLQTFLTLRQQLKKRAEVAQHRIVGFHRPEINRANRLYGLFLCEYRLWNQSTRRCF